LASQGEVISGFISSQGRRLFTAEVYLRALVLWGSILLAGLYFITSPATRSVPGLAVQPATSAALPEPVTVTLPVAADPSLPRTAQVLSLRLGPSPNETVLGLVPRGAVIQIVGKSEDGVWLAVAISPGSILYGWVQAGDVLNQPDLTTLPVKQAASLSRP
jgi:hypothetical protein